MSELEPLILDMCEWIARAPRTYVDVMAAWRTSCPRLTVWEDAVDRGLIERVMRGTDWHVEVTETGYALLAAHGRAAQIAEPA